MTNNNINTDTLRRALEGNKEAREEVRAMLPTPRTLADMAPEERAECEWMQCDHPALEESGVILQIWGNGCHVLSREGVVETEALNHVTPRPDLPRMEWPGNEPEEAHVDSPEPAVPRPEDVPETAEQDDEPVLPSDYIYTDKDGDKWEHIDGRWITGNTRAERVAAREDRRGLASLPVRYGPYTRIEKENHHDD